MDKYTVDLDQVLNDFEYSELTDQHSSNHKQNFNNFKNSNVKHSINNVFHSLNEYLNTDISPKCEPILPETGENSANNAPEEVTQSDENHVIEAENGEINHVVEEETEIISLVEDKNEESDQEESEETVEVESRDSPPVEENQVALVATNESIEQKTDEPSDLESEEKGDTGVSKVGFDDDIDLDESELNRYLDELEQEYDNTTPKTSEEDETTSSVRPNNLPLPQQEDEKPVIDLVGEPGSTPYNNVYVNKELPQEVKQNSDTECSTSASPTFSDISSETNSSCTPSTDTVEEPAREAAPTEPPEGGAGDQLEPPQVSDATLGKQAPVWIPDSEALNCQHCDTKFTVIKRRHHCRACGYVLCSKCCNLKYRLEYLDDVARVCTKCYEQLEKAATVTNSSDSESNSPRSQPNPNNPLEYCSTVPPHQQVAGNVAPPAVMVPVGVLKRKGSSKRTNKSVMFCDGIRPGSDLTNLDNDFNYSGVKGGEKNFPVVDPETNSFIPKGDDLPPTVTINKSDVSYLECSNGPNVVEMLKNETLIFSLQTNLLVHVKIINMDCCINKTAWCFSTEGLINVGQDEIVILLELLDDEKTVPKDVFFHLNYIYLDAVKGTSVKEMGLSLHSTTNFLGSKNHAGFVYIRPTFQCLCNVIKPQEPFLIGVLIHRWETSWAKLFPLRLILRLGAEYRYYPSPIISNRYRDSVFVEIGHTIINLLADFRNFSYTLPQIRGLSIHMEDKNTTVTIPSNRYDQVMKSMNNSSDHILAFAGNFSCLADSHLVCIQDTQSNENTYSTHAINIHNKPRKVTGASFIVFNGALKSSSGLTAKSSIVEDGLMIQIPSEHMTQIRESLRNMKNHTIQCGCINATSDETVNIVWGEPDSNFNVGVFSPIDNKSMEGIPSIRVHNGKDYVNGGRFIRWTEVFIVQNEGEASRNQDPIDISKVSETIAKATCTALVKYLDLLISNSFYKIGIRANLNALFVAYCAGSNGVKLPPIYMESLDNELVPVLHKHATSDCDENTIILELIFRILNK
ncbi:zinc finger FYVE domain-containing protein 9 [Tribolium castaneum]|uniref:Zinc finger FYVE domain-containing protein 9-like Protein n=1 Tax=Tribolium castaneum TaxID=7070 RepID=D2A5B9_TRICA|nr:PREDICTED: zinc finger FYVE domain-containing protein 9 [Tribolium castaneum]EFA05099.1 Zinc finger FYVE domain-containing protein 9-like Protein [Tribolium castaneum]|eukprot:XP_974100.1 PREDICTED: zinc finger FYVE domain-containing protein 9 [Tribolium castaneum]